VAKATSKTEQNLLTRVIGPIAGYLRDTRAELRKVTWPTREEAYKLTLIVLGTVIVMSLILGLADFIFAKIMQGIIVGNVVWVVVGVLVVVVGAVAIYLIGRE
jgi:preprotein translocase subunit SecE